MEINQGWIKENIKVVKIPMMHKIISELNQFAIKYNNTTEEKTVLVLSFLEKAKFELEQLTLNVDGPVDFLAWRTRNLLEMLIKLQSYEKNGNFLNKWKNQTLEQQYRISEGILNRSLLLENEFKEYAIKLNDIKNKKRTINCEKNHKTEQGDELDMEIKAMDGNFLKLKEPVELFVTAARKKSENILKQIGRRKIASFKHNENIKGLAGKLGGDLKNEYDGWYTILCAFIHPSPWKISIEVNGLFTEMYKSLFIDKSIHYTKKIFIAVKSGLKLQND